MDLGTLREHKVYNYGEACPVSKASAVLCERWTLQIVREMLLGATRFSQLQRQLPKISPSLLNTRLKLLVDTGIAIRKRTPEQRGFEYHLTPAGKNLEGVIAELGKWGMRWIFDGLDDEELDAVVLLGHMAVLLDVDELPACDTVLQFTFTDLPDPQMFIFVHDGRCEVCDINPGHEVDVFVRSTLRALSEVFWGERELREAIRDGAVTVVGPSAYTRNIARWFPVSPLVGERNVSPASRSRSRAGRIGSDTSC